MYYSNLTVIDAHSWCDRMPRALSAANTLCPSFFACSTSKPLASSLSLPLRLRTAVSSRRFLPVLALAAAFWCFVHAAFSTFRRMFRLFAGIEASLELSYTHTHTHTHAHAHAHAHAHTHTHTHHTHTTHTPHTHTPHTHTPHTTHTHTHTHTRGVRL